MATAKRDPVHWGQFVSLSRRFQRSVHLERDADNLVWLDDYVLTPLVSSTIERIGSGLTSDATSRAWSITGPYGSGKSALALFLSQLLSVPEAAEAKRARRVFDRGASSLSKSLFTRGGPLHGTKGLVPVRATGERAPLELVLVRALHDSAESFWSGRGAKPDVYWDVLNALRLLNSGKALGTRNVVKLFEEMTAKVVSSNRSGRGLLVLLDEAGKTLEHAALQPSAGDVHLLQELAEAASRSGDTPIVLVVLLHQSFEQYASRLSSVQRNEWSKVQGRFVPNVNYIHPSTTITSPQLSLSPLPSCSSPLS